ncbi:hypothetical protein Pyn_32770 [Prunus yedoensis var. nudiflora]|uniref:Uncharacterized protein n=1 Tax=Prunus yedoensis var. nudiflora TaxID=2094558 RepID=A0A314YJT1_PRUYE|nr:hypothetical protein Pyn_32770 [Prunus yedoensis var. nudiflora]
MADKRFLDANGQYGMPSEQGYKNDKVRNASTVIWKHKLTGVVVFLGIVLNSKSGSRGCALQILVHQVLIHARKCDIVSICKRRGGSDTRNLSHNEWLQTVQFEPDIMCNPNLRCHRLGWAMGTHLVLGIGGGDGDGCVSLHTRCPSLVLGLKSTTSLLRGKGGFLSILLDEVVQILRLPVTVNC